MTENDLKTIESLIKDSYRDARPEKKRECGRCSLCCRVIGVPETKPDHEWCPFVNLSARGPKGDHCCSIYRTRPERCRDFHCQWLIDRRFPDYWYPLKSRIVISIKIEKEKSFVCFIVDPDYPLRWREEPYFSDIKKIAKIGLEGRLGKKWTTVIVIKNEQIPIIR